VNFAETATECPGLVVYDPSTSLQRPHVTPSFTKRLTEEKGLGGLHVEGAKSGNAVEDSRDRILLGERAREAKANRRRQEEC